MPAPAPPLPIIVCPLEFERQALARAGLGRHAELLCCGPGHAGPMRLAEMIDPGERLVVLAGLAGALDTLEAGTAVAVKAVHDEESARMLRPPVVLSGAPRASVSSAGATLTSPDAKRLWREHAGTDIVDLESASFATVASDRGWRWAIVRGISDGLDDALPDAVDEWVNEHGGSRSGRAVTWLARRPWRVTQLTALRRRASEAMVSVAAVLARALVPEGARS